jgi:Stage II sporulation protein E (SpoIIE)
MKKILANIAPAIDDVFGQFGASAHRAANRLRWFYGALFLIATLWNLGDTNAAMLIYPILALLWLLAALAFGLRAKTNLSNNGIVAIWIDVAILCFGLLLCAWLGVFNSKGWLVFLCAFPVLALTARRCNLLLVLQVAAFFLVFYALVSLFAIGSLALPRLLAIAAMAMATAALTHRPKKELTEVAQKAAQDAYQLGASEKEAELTAFVHKQSFPPVRYQLPGLYATYKHGVGSDTSGDFYAAFETAKGPMVVLGDLTGKGLNAALIAAEVHQDIRKLASEKETLTEIAAALNEKFWLKNQLTSCVLARWEGANLHYVNAGHLPIIHISKREPEQYPANSAWLGANQSATFREDVIAFAKGDMLLLHTDGAYAGLAQERLPGAAEIFRLVQQFSSGEVNTLCHRVFDCGLPEYKQPQDDSTVVVVRRQEVE